MAGRHFRYAILVSLICAVAASGASARASHGPGSIPLTDLGAGTYLGFQGGLYEGGSNSVPSDHAAAGQSQIGNIDPLDAGGNPSASGKIVLLSVGMSNTTQEFCSASSALPCDSWTFMGQAGADPDVNHTSLTIVNGAAGGQAATTWDSPSDANYDRVRDTRLTPQGLSEQQVQVVWVKQANPGPTISLPAANADAYALETSLGNITRALKVRYPNVRAVFLSNRIYAGYATTALNPEPYAYETGFSAKWLVQAQIDQMRNGGVVVDARAGDLNYNTVAPWIAWGPDLWADGLIARSDGLTWVVTDLSSDGTHPAQPGRQKVGTMLLDFFSSSPFTECWFLVDVDGDGASDACDSGDFDGDLLSDQTEYFCGSPRNDAAKRPERLDGAFAGDDDDGDTMVDEPLPGGSASFDCDGDGYRGDGPGIGNISEKRMYMAAGTTNDQDPCGGSGWPADLATTGPSLNRINLTDVSSFVSGSPRKFGTDPGDLGYDVRWDLVTGNGAAPPKDISLTDLTNITTLLPPMLFGVKAFGGPVCPWPP